MRPDTYVGSTKPVTEDHWVASDPDDKPVTFDHKSLTYVPGLLRLYLEILSNAVDCATQSPPEHPCTSIDISVTEDTITVTNDGQWVDTGPFSDDDNTPIPTYIFGRLLTSSNYDDDESKARWVVGRNGYGAKLANIFSTQFKIKLYDRGNNTQFTQTWSDNMAKRGKHKVSALPKSAQNKPGGKTQVSFTPDFPRFGYSTPKFTDDDIQVFRKYAYDASASTGIKVRFNKERIHIKTINQYATMYLKGSGAHKPLVFEDTQPKAKIRGAVSVVLDIDNTKPRIVSFVNGMETKSGGKHVDAVLSPLISALRAELTRKYKDMPASTFSTTKLTNLICLVIDARVDKPEFDHQTKDTLTAPPLRKLDMKSIAKKLCNQSTFDRHVTALVEQVEDRHKKKGDTARKRKNVELIDGAEDANWAGTKRSSKCTLILTEGKSASGFARDGMGSVGRDVYGTLPLGGKVLNALNAKSSDVASNTILKAIKCMLGLSSKRNYKRPEDFATLRYGRLLILTDADPDGFHIAGLIIVYISTMFPSLINRDTPFVEFSLTPIQRVHLKSHHIKDGKVEEGKPRGSKTYIDCYSAAEYRNVCAHLRELEADIASVQYYKGLGRWDSRDIPALFDKISWSMQCDDEAYKNVQKVFMKKNAEQRKKWLLGNPVHLEGFKEYVADVNREIVNACLSANSLADRVKRPYDISTFMDKNVIEFSWVDIIRSIAHVVDGMKPSQRKIIAAAFKKGLTPTKGTIRVAQLAAYTSEAMDYHQGEASLEGAIVKMAQDYVGSNNCPLLDTKGNFGSRCEGGKDAASPRYIETKLTPMAHAIFKEEDEKYTVFNRDPSGEKIEPVHYWTTIPLILVNGAVGIGTGFSQTIPCHDLRDVVKSIKKWIDDPDKPVENIEPWYLDFTGDIALVETKKGMAVRSQGIIEEISPGKCKITELPVGTWSTKYYTILNDHVTNKRLADVQTHCSSREVDITVEMNKGDDPSKFNWGLTSSDKYHLTAIDTQMMPWKYSGSGDIIERFCRERIKVYEMRYTGIREELEWNYMTHRIRSKFIRDVNGGKLHPMDLTEEVLRTWLMERYSAYCRDDIYGWLPRLLDVTMRQLGNVNDAVDAADKYKVKLEAHRQKTPTDLWIDDLDELESVYSKWLIDRKQR